MDEDHYGAFCWDPDFTEYTLGPWLGLAGFAVQLLLPETFVFTRFFDGFHLILAGTWVPRTRRRARPGNPWRRSKGTFVFLWFPNDFSRMLLWDSKSSEAHPGSGSRECIRSKAGNARNI